MAGREKIELSNELEGVENLVKSPSGRISFFEFGGINHGQEEQQIGNELF